MPTEKNHYIPKFYTKAWATGADQMLVQFWRPPGRAVVHYRKAPGAVGFMYGLYTVEGLPEQAAYWIEDTFLLSADNDASVALELLLTDRHDDVQGNRKSAWSRFLNTLLHRNPEKIAWLKQVWAAKAPERHAALKDNYLHADGSAPPGLPPTFEEYEADQMPNEEAKGFIHLLQKVLDSERTGNQLNSMKWAIINIEQSPEKLLTSDRPVMLWKKLDTGYLTLPISPQKLFVAYNDDATMRELQSHGARYLTAICNNRVASQAAQYVYGQDANLLQFVERRLGKDPEMQRLATFQK